MALQRRYASLESFYTGSYGPLDPTYGELFTGYRIPFEKIASETWASAERAQIQEVTARLSEGTKAVELKTLSSDVLERIPKGIGGMKEMEQLAKLTGANFMLHGPHNIDPAGFTERGWSESSREESETRFKNVIDRAHELNPKGNVPVVMHSTAGVPSTQWKVIKGEPKKQMIIAVNQETGQFVPVEREVRYFPEEEVKKPMDMLKIKNETEQHRNMFELSKMLKDREDDLKAAWPIIAPRWKEIQKAQAENRLGELELDPSEQFALNRMALIQRRDQDIYSLLTTFWERAHKFTPEEEREKKEEFFRKKRDEFIKAGVFMRVDPVKAQPSFQDLINSLPKTQLYVPSEDFALKHSKETLANAALYAYKKYGDNAPSLAMENIYPGTVFSRGEELAKLIKESRKEFIEKAKKVGISEARAKEAAQKMIGATWDVGHIHLLKKYGFGVKKGKYDEKEFKRIMAAESKAIAPFVKHVHLTDNFGFEDSHLPPGMGEIPIKEMLKELEKAGYKGRYVLEAGGFVTQFKQSPTPYALEALGSPLYGMQMQPFWNQVRGQYGIPSGYSAGHGMMLPEQHFGIYGAGFAALPMELGGRMPGKGQRFAGAPME